MVPLAGSSMTDARDESTITDALIGSIMTDVLTGSNRVDALTGGAVTGAGLACSIVVDALKVTRITGSAAGGGSCLGLSTTLITSSLLLRSLRWFL